MILKLMIVEIKRYLRSLYYLVVLFILFLIHMLGLKGGVPFLFWGDDFLENVNFICIVLSLLIRVQKKPNLYSGSNCLQRMWKQPCIT